MELTFNRSRAMARALLTSAEQQIREEAVRSRNELTQLRAEAHTSGLAEGMARLVDARDKLQAAEANLLETLAPKLTGLVRQITAEVLGEELKLNPSSITQRVQKALSLLKGTTIQELSFNSTKSEHLHSLENQIKVLKADDSLATEDFVIEGDFGRLLSSPTRHLNRLLDEIQL